MTQDRTSEALAIFQAQFPGDQSREVTDAAFLECKVDMTRLRKLPDAVEWDKDPYKILATKMFGGKVEDVDLAKRRAAKLAFWTCVTTIQPDWAES